MSKKEEKNQWEKNPRLQEHLDDLEDALFSDHESEENEHAHASCVQMLRFLEMALSSEKHMRFPITVELGRERDLCTTCREEVPVILSRLGLDGVVRCDMKIGIGRYNSVAISRRLEVYVEKNESLNDDSLIP